LSKPKVFEHKNVKKGPIRHIPRSYQLKDMQDKNYNLQVKIYKNKMHKLKFLKINITIHKIEFTIYNNSGSRLIASLWARPKVIPITK
jgi:hypothetical protein